MYRSRWQIERLINHRQPFWLLVRLRSSYPEAVRAIVLAALVGKKRKGKCFCAAWL